MSSTNVTTLARPPRRNTNTKGEAPAATEVSANLQKPSNAERIQLPFQVTTETRRTFKAYAAERDMSMSDLFMLIWEDYRSRNG